MHRSSKPPLLTGRIRRVLLGTIGPLQLHLLGYIGLKSNFHFAILSSSELYITILVWFTNRTRFAFYDLFMYFNQYRYLFTTKVDETRQDQ